jgi:hypothetical protein
MSVKGVSILLNIVDLCVDNRESSNVDIRSD